MSMIGEGTAISLIATRQSSVVGTRIGRITRQLEIARRPGPGGDPAAAVRLEAELQEEMNYSKALEAIQKIGESLKAMGFGFLDRVIQGFRPST